MKRRLHTEFLGRSIVYTQSTSSTNDDAKAAGLARPDGTVFMSEVQTGGKGRIGRRWSSPFGGIYMSIVLKPFLSPSLAAPDLPAPNLPALSIVAGYCVATAIRDTTGLDARIKWPNDVLVEGRKVSGILCEAVLPPDAPPLVIVGIGVNANVDVENLPEEVRGAASSLRALLGRRIDRATLVSAILDRLEPAYQEFLSRGLSPLVRRIEDVAAFIGDAVIMRNVTSSSSDSTQGIFRGIDERGRALLEVPGGEVVAVSAGDLTLRRI